MNSDALKNEAFMSVVRVAVSFSTVALSPALREPSNQASSRPRFSQTSA